MSGDRRRRGRRLRKVREGKSVGVRKKVKDRSRRVRVKVQVTLKVRTSLRVMARKGTIGMGSLGRVKVKIQAKGNIEGLQRHLVKV